MDGTHFLEDGNFGKGIALQDAMEFGLGSDKNPVDIQMSIEVVLGGFGMDGSPETIL